MKLLKQTFKSLYYELIFALIISFGVSIGLFFFLNHLNENLYSSKWANTTYLYQQLNSTVENFNEYIADNNVASTGYEDFEKWSKEHDLVYFYIKKDDKTVFDSSLASFLAEMEEENIPYTDEEIQEYISDDVTWFNYKKYDITLSDGTAKLYIWGDFAYSLYNRIYVISIVLCGLIAFLIFILFVRKKIHYIKEISKDISILEGGDLNYQIPVKGNDELSQVAGSLNSMRIALAQQMENEKKALQANNSLVTALSHDLRTPLTTQMGYLEILKEHHYNSKEELDEYVDTALKTCHQIKEMSDRLFEYFLAFDPNPERSSEDLEEYEGMDLFMQLFSEFSLPLINQGFRFTYGQQIEPFKVRVNMNDILRIFNNVFTNIDKYADDCEDVVIDFKNDEEKVILSITNKIRKVPRKNESAKIGLISISSLMKRQRGSSKTRTSEDTFCIELIFPKY